MSDYRWSRLGTEDVRAWSDLLTQLDAVDGSDEAESPENLAERLRTVGVDPGRDTWAVWDGARLVGYAFVMVNRSLTHEGDAKSFISGGVHPDHRRRGLGTRLMDLAEERAVELLTGRHPGANAHIGAGGGVEGDPVRHLLEPRGYAVVRHFDQLTRPLGEEPEVPEVEGVELVSPEAEHEGPVLVAHNAAFRDHWGSGDTLADAWHDRWGARSTRLGLSTVAVARGGAQDGTVLAYVLAGEWDDQAYIGLVGTVPQARGRGLAAATLARTIGLATVTGRYSLIQLHVDSDSPTGATRLYERLGFTLTRRTAALRRRLGTLPG